MPKGTLTSAQLDASSAAPALPVTPTPPAAQQEGVRSIETYRGDIENLVKDKNVSVLSIAAAEAARRGSHQSDAIAPSTPKQSSGLLKTIGLYALGLVLLVGASGALAYIVERPTSVATPPAAPAAPFIAVDDTKDITIAGGTPRASLMGSLTAARDSTSLSLGLIARLLVTVASTTPAGTQVLMPIDAQSFFTIIAPNMPGALLRTISPTYLLGVHVYTTNAPFLILHVDSYEQAYAGMIAWEPYMQQDLAPLFTTAAPIHIPEEGIATSTPAPSVQFFQTGFTDSIVENHDARVIQNSSGDISLLWTFIDRNTLVIATNSTTVREIISRLKDAPVTPNPGQ